MMTHTINADELIALADAAPSEELLGVAEPVTEGQSAEWDEPDDGVEALIIPMDRTTAERVFLQAHWDLRREAAKALVEEDH